MPISNPTTRFGSVQSQVVVVRDRNTPVSAVQALPMMCVSGSQNTDMP